MTLIDAMKEKCVLIEKQRTADGEGGFITTYVNGAEFYAAITFDSSMQAKIAESNGVKSLYSVVTSRSINLDYHDIIKRVSDGAYFRITSAGNAQKSPAISSLDILKNSAERIEIPT